MKKITLLLSFSLLVLSASAQFPLLYSFDSVKTTSGTTDPSFVPTATGVTAGSFMATGTPPNSLAAFRFDFSDWATGSTGGVADTLYVGMTGIVSTAEYYEVTLTPTGGYVLNLDTIKFAFERSGTGVRTYAVRSSADAYTLNLSAVYLPPNTNVDVQAGNVFFLKRDITTVQNRSNIILGGASFTNISTPITFRFYAWNSEASSGTFSIDNVRFIGNAAVATGIEEKNNFVTSVHPNPSSNGLFTIDAKGKNTIRIYNIIGSMIFEKEINGKEMIDLSAQANGSYFITIGNEKESITQKLIIRK